MKRLAFLLIALILTVSLVTSCVGGGTDPGTDSAEAGDGAVTSAPTGSDDMGAYEPDGEEGDTTDGDWKSPGTEPTVDYDPTPPNTEDAYRTETMEIYPDEPSYGDVTEESN